MGNPVSDVIRDFAVAELELEAEAILDHANIKKITKIVDAWYEERYDTDWDTLQESLMKIYKLVHKK